MNARRRIRIRCLILFVGIFAGCSSTPRVPRDFDWRETDVVVLPRLVDPVPTGAPGKGEAAAAGAFGGATAGLASGTLACLAAGPLFPLCVAVIVPSTTVLTAAGTAAASAILADSAEVVQAKRDLLRQAWSASEGQLALVTALQRQLNGDAEKASGVANWTVQVALVHLDTGGNGADTPFGLVAAGELQVLPATGGDAVFVGRYPVASASRHTLPDWQAHDGAAVRATLDDMLVALAVKMKEALDTSAR